MKELPKGAVPMLIAIGFVLIGFLVWQLRENSHLQQTDQTLDELNVQTDNPQRAGRNVP